MELTWKDVVLAGMGALLLLGFYFLFQSGTTENIKEESPQPVFEVTAQVIEVGEDGCCSYFRKYKAKSWEQATQTGFKLKDATDEEGNHFREILLLNIPVIIVEGTGEK